MSVAARGEDHAAILRTRNKVRTPSPPGGRKLTDIRQDSVRVLLDAGRRLQLPQV